MFHAKCVEKNQNTHFMLDNFFFFRKSCRLCDNVEKCGRTTEAINHGAVRRRKKNAIFVPANLGDNTNTRNILFLLLHN